MTKRDAVHPCRSAFDRVDVVRLVVAGLLLAAPATGFAQSSGTAEGEAIYRARCIGCHESSATRAPDLAALRAMSPDSVLTTLRTGSMSTQAQGLSTVQLDNLSRFVAGADTVQNAARSNGACMEPSAQLAEPLARPHWNGWGGDLSQQRFQPAAMAQLNAEDVPRLKLKWAFGFAGATRAQAQPTLMGGQLFVGSQSGKVYALDARTGCTRRRSACARRSPSRRAERAGRPISATSAAMPMRSTR